MTLSAVIGLSIALGLATISIATTRKPVCIATVFGAVALLAGSLWIGSLVVFCASMVAAGVTLYRWQRLSARRGSRAVADMDQDVQERIRAIAAESRYSSAGIEF